MEHGSTGLKKIPNKSNLGTHEIVFFFSKTSTIAHKLAEMIQTCYFTLRNLSLTFQYSKCDIASDTADMCQA